MRKMSFLGFLLAGLVMLAVPTVSLAQISVGISVRVGPPPLPVYAQPVCPGPGYIWTPGYWAYGPDGYYWVPGTWVIAPRVGLLWTPGYWGWAGGVYVWHAGYWGPHVGFYGGINYGFGYVGVGYLGGYWNHGVFAYNTAVTNVNTTVIHNTYVSKTVINNNVTVNRTSYNGGAGGVTAQPTAAERSLANEQHIQPTAAQTQHEHAASTNRALLASANHGQPSIAATSKPGEFSGHGVTSAKPARATFRPPAHNNAANRPPSTNHANSFHPNTANASRGNAHPKQNNVHPYSASAPHNNAHPAHNQPPPSHSQPPPKGNLSHER
jgi:hypothetical protein